MTTSGNDRREANEPVSRFVTHLECAMTGERYEPVKLCRPQLGSSASDGAPFVAV
jgi:hypothetical protein